MSQNKDFPIDQSIIEFSANNFVDSEENVKIFSQKNNPLCIKKANLQDNLQSVADYIISKYPSILDDNVKVSDLRIFDICNQVFKVETYKLRNSIAKALSRDTSTLCKLIRGNSSEITNNMIIQNDCVENSRCSSEVVAEICNVRKCAKNPKNVMRLRRQCKKVTLNETCKTASLPEGEDLYSVISEPGKEIICNVTRENEMDVEQLENDILICSKSNDTNNPHFNYVTINTFSVSNNNSIQNSSCGELDFLLKDNTDLKKVTTIVNSNFDTNSSDLSRTVHTEFVPKHTSEQYANISNESEYIWMIGDVQLHSTPKRPKSIGSENNSPCKRLNKKSPNVIPSPLRDAYFKRTPVKGGVILPLNTKNNYLLNIRYNRKENDFKEFSFLEGKLRFTKREWSNMVYQNEKGQTRLQTARYPIMFRKRMKTVNNTCVINAKMVKYFKHHCNVYMYCSHPGCKTFKIKVQTLTNDTTLGTVYSSGLNYYHNPADDGLTNHVKGFQRDLVKETLKTTKAFAYKSGTIDMASPTQLKCGNLQDIKSDEVVRKMKSESITADDYDKDDFLDMLLMFNDKEDDYVKHVGLPSIHCYSSEQLNILKKVIKTRQTATGYLDATGSIVRKVDKCSKRVLYYALVVNAPLPRNTSVTCPVLEMISSAHDIVAISQWLNAYKAFVLKHKLIWPVFSNIVTDFSYAQMNALCIGWNGFISIFDYLNWCYKVLVENHDGSGVTIINICVNHYTKIIVNHVYTYFQSTTNNNTLQEKNKRNDIIDWICLLFNMTNLEDIDKWFRLFSIILLSPTVTDECTFAIRLMRANCNVDYQLKNELYNDDQNFLDEINKFLCESLTSNSRMYCKFQLIKEKVKSKIQLDDTKSEYKMNGYLEESYLQEFTNKFIPFIALWTPIMNTKVGNGVENRQSNATVEAYFKKLKKDMLNGDCRLKCSRLVKTTRHYNLNVHKQTKYTIRRKRCTRVLDFESKSKQLSLKPRMESLNENHLEVQENWGKKEKQPKHLQPVLYRPFTKLSLKVPKSVNKIVEEKTISPYYDEQIENFVTDNKSMKFNLNNESLHNGEQKDKTNGPLQSFNDKDPKKSVSTPGSHKSPISLQTAMMELYEKSKQPKDLTYYKRPRKLKDYVVGSYGFIPTDETNRVMKELYFSDFDTLSGEGWLSNFLIDICLASKAQIDGLKDIQILSCNTMIQFQREKKEISEKHDKLITLKHDCMVILPWLVGCSHWIIAFIDFRARQCYIMDPLDPYDIDGRISKNRFKELTDALKSNVNFDNERDFLLEFIACPFVNVPKQADGFNCGVFVLYYAFTIMNKSNFSLQFDKIGYRDYLKKYLLANSEDMTNICLYCSHHSDKHRPHINDLCVEWVSCTSCCRWAAIKCIPVEDRIENYEANDFFCLLCKK